MGGSLALVSVHRSGYLLDGDGLLHLVLHPVLFSVCGNTVIGGINAGLLVIPCRFIQFIVFLEPTAQWSIRLHNVVVVGVVVTHDVVDDAAQFLFGFLSLGCTSINRMVLLGV